MKKHILIQNHFFTKAKSLRQTFEQNFSQPTQSHSDRFVWDYWYVPEQYRLIRTSADYYFRNNKAYQQLLHEIVAWGRSHLGCHSISPPWLSYYVEGCRQNFHSDVPQGPWAYVYSLSPQKPKYTGGETIILKPEVTNFWNHFSDQTEHEFHQFFDVVPSPFNRLTIFDPRLPHGVSEVKGVEDPREARLVLHGWFVEPRPYVVGPLTTAQVQKALNPAFQNLEKVIEPFGRINGTMSFCLSIERNGEVSKVRLLTDTLICPDLPPHSVSGVCKSILSEFVDLTFAKCKGSSTVTIPLLFRNS